jgi:hypothetical protein
MTPCILVVAVANSVNTLRWLQMTSADRYHVVLLPATRQPNLEEFSRSPAITSSGDLRSLAPGQVGIWAGAQPVADENHPSAMPLPIEWRRQADMVHGEIIADAVRVLHPLMVHSMGVQHASYACLVAAKLLGADFPPWLVSSWGSDLFLYEKLEEHRTVLLDLVARADALHSECRRDGAIARRLGYDKAKPLFVMPASGGKDLQRLPMPPIPPSERDIILVKGHHGWTGRAMHVLSALLLAAPQLGRFRIRIVQGSEPVVAMAREVARITTLDIQIEGWSDDRQVALRRMAAARIAIGIGISDGIGTSFLEAMALGAFPIAATTACAAEWVRNGIDGLIVDPHDVNSLAQAIIRAATDDELVDAASLRNRREVEQRWNVQVNRELALRMYDEIMAGAHERRQR